MLILKKHEMNNKNILKNMILKLLYIKLKIVL